MSDNKIVKRSPRKLKKKPTDTVLIRKANDLVEARYKFDIWETRLFIKMLTMIRADDRDFFEYKIYISDLVKDFKLENSKDTYKRVKDGARKLLTKIIKVVVKDEGNLVEMETPIVGMIKKTLDEGDGSYIKLGFYPDMKPFLLALKERYLVYDFRNVRNLTSPYYVRLYELLKQYEKIGERYFEVEDLKEILGLTQEYKLYGHFKSKILDKAQAKLLEFTDIYFTYEEIKKGRAVWALTFKIHKNRPVGLQLPEENDASDLFFPEENKTQGTSRGAENPIFDSNFERLNEWWGVEKEELRRRIAGKTQQDIDRAVHFTKERVKIGKAANPAGVFLDALAKGHKTPEQHLAEKMAEKKRKELEKQTQLQPLVLEYQTTQTEYTQTINDGIRAVIKARPDVTELVVERIKMTYQSLGDKSMAQKTVEDFRRDAMLRSLVKAEIMKEDNERFDAINDRYGLKIRELKNSILELDPNFVFDFN